jgi:hypothetical protein
MLIHREEVALGRRTIFGPDVDDVGAWREIATAVVDGLQEALELPKNRSTGGPVA